MKYISTRDNNLNFSVSEAMLHGLAPDGGLFIPASFPVFDEFQSLVKLTYPELCQTVLTPFFQDDVLASELKKICQQAFNFPVPLNKINDNTDILELFHGPTLAFKDFGARFLACCLSKLAKQKLTIMVATSGDTGSAVAAAFHQQPNIDVIVLFPENKISPNQQQQITCWDENIHAFAVRGTFDDCQHLVKSAFADPNWQNKFSLCTANSINIGRLLPQACYYAYASLHYLQQYQSEAKFVVPSGNLGNVTAAFWAKQMGFPIAEIVIATNANKVVPDYLATGEYSPRNSIETLANAMDVGKPSNFERLIHLFPEFIEFKNNVTAFSVSDAEIKQTIQAVYSKNNLLICPHTATAYQVRQQLNTDPWIIVATAHPCKFNTVIEPIIHDQVPMHPNLADLLAKESYFQTINPQLSEIETTFCSQ